MGMQRQLKVVNETRVDVSLDTIGFWQDLADDRDVLGTLRLLPFTSETPFGEVIDRSHAVVYVSGDERITPDIFLRSNGAHEIRHLEQNQKSWLVDWFVREKLIANLLRADGLQHLNKDFLNRHHEELPDEVDAFVFEKEVVGFDSRPFAVAVRLAMEGRGDWPNPARYSVRVTRHLLRGEK